jgi:3-methyladenine DNA glycosylase/8-oxoguanine DNA glycosylase
LDRVHNIIDLSGFTRITKQLIGDTLKLENISADYWAAAKEIGENQPYLRLYIENPDKMDTEAIYERINKRMKSLDSDYNDIHEMLGHDPLKITIVKEGSFETFKQEHGKDIGKINPSADEVTFLLNM